MNPMKKSMKVPFSLLISFGPTFRMKKGGELARRYLKLGTWATRENKAVFRGIAARHVNTINGAKGLLRESLRC